MKPKLIALTVCACALLAAAQTPKPPGTTDLRADAPAMGGPISAADQKLVQAEARAFTDKACTQGTFTSVTTPKPPQVTFESASATTTAMLEQGGGRVVKEEVTDESMRLYAVTAGIGFFSYASLLGGDQVKTLGCIVQ